jgi:DNA-binding LytR/AlgR family response regulator
MLFERIRTLLARPFPAELDTAKRIWTSFLFGVGVASFLVVFEPFGLSRVHSVWKTWQILGYGAITFVWMMANYFVLPLVMPRTFQEERWTVGKYIAFTVWNVVVIALSNYLYSRFIFNASSGLVSLVHFMLWTILLGVPPVTILTFVLERRLLKRHLAEATRISTALESASETISNTALEGTQRESLQSPPHSPTLITLTGSGAKERYALHPASILCLQASDNYVTVYVEHLDNNHPQVQTLLLRATLKALEEQIAVVPRCVRCHKSFIVNLAHVERVSGNAQGYKLHLPAIDFAIPVSRSLQKHILGELHHLAGSTP